MCNIDNLLLFELISVAQNQSEQHSKPVQLFEVLWQYHVHHGFKKQVLTYRSHQDK